MKVTAILRLTLENGSAYFYINPYRDTKIFGLFNMTEHSSEKLFADPPDQVKFDECLYYHVMELPGSGVTTGQWDLRDHLEDYFGGVDFHGKRVLEIGPASGFLTFEMERRGAEVTCFEVSDEIGWDFVPYPSAVLERNGKDTQAHREHLRGIKNSWWFSRKAFGGNARICYGNVYDLPAALGNFDIAIVAAVLTHTRSPVSILEQCARRCDAIIITEPHDQSLDGRPICRLSPTGQNLDYGTWWLSSPDFYRQYLDVLGFETPDPIFHSPRYHDIFSPMYTVVGHRRD